MRPWQERFPWTHGVLRFFWPDRAARRKRWVVLAGVVLILVAFHAVLTVALARRLTRLTDALASEYGPLACGTLRPPAVPDADNAARAVRAATEMLVSDHEALAEALLDETPSTKIEELAEANKVALALLDEAARRPAANWNLDYARGFEADVPPLLRILDLAKFNAAAGRLAIRAGRQDDALIAVARGKAIERSLTQEAALIVQLVHGAVNRVNAALVREMIESGRLDGPGLDRLATVLPPADPGEAIHRSLVGEMKVVHESYHRGFELRAPMGGGMMSRAPRLLAPLSWLLRPFLLENDRVSLVYIGRVIAAQQMPRHDRPALGMEERLRPWHVLAKMMIPNLDNAVDRGDLWEARESMTRLALAIERYRAARARPPESLEALVPAFLDAVPKDPFGGGASFAYRRTEDGWTLAAGDSWRRIDLPPEHDQVLEWGRPVRVGARPER